MPDSGNIESIMEPYIKAEIISPDNLYWKYNEIMYKQKR